MSEVRYLIYLPQPPEAVAEAIEHWIQWLRFLPKAGPRAQTTCAGIEKHYAHITKKLQAQYHPSEPDERAMYDWRKGEAMEAYIHELSDRRRDIVIGVHIKHTKIPVMLRTHKVTEDKFINELRSAYNALAGKLCRKK